MIRIVILGLCLALVGCVRSPPAPTLTPTTVEVTTYVPYVCGTPPAVDQVSLLSVEFRILPVLEEQLFTLTADMYENLGKNVSAVLAGTKQLRAQRDFYAECIRASQNALTNVPE